MGTCTLYASRVALPICAIAMAQEYSWSKKDSVNIFFKVMVLDNYF